MALKVYLEEDLAEEAQQVLDAGRVGSAKLLAPTLILPEFRHALAKRNRRGELSSTETQEIWENFGYYPLSFFEIGPLVPRAAEIVDRLHRLRCHLRGSRGGRKRGGDNCGAKAPEHPEGHPFCWSPLALV